MTLNPRTSNLYWNDANFHEAVHLLQNNLIQVMRVLADYVGMPVARDIIRNSLNLIMTDALLEEHDRMIADGQKMMNDLLIRHLGHGSN